MTTPSTSTSPSPFVAKLMGFLRLIERGLLVATAAGIAILYLDKGQNVLFLSLNGLAIVYFLMAFRVLEIPREENKPAGFKELLAWVILPKVMWLGCSVSIVAARFYFVNVGNGGDKEMAMIGGTVLLAGSVILGLLVIAGVRHIGKISPVLFRALPLLLLDAYVFLK